MSRQFVLIPRKREIPLGHMIRSRDPDPSDVVEFDDVAPMLPDVELYDDDQHVRANDPRLAAIAASARRDEQRFVQLCQRHRIIPPWWRKPWNFPYRVKYKGVWHVHNDGRKDTRHVVSPVCSFFGSIGDRVRHLVFRDGTVIGLDYEHVTVRFDKRKTSYGDTVQAQKVKLSIRYQPPHPLTLL